MNAREAAKLLAVCATRDKRTTGDADVISWTQALADLGYDDCERAVLAHYNETDDFVTPANVRRRVKAIRAQRIADTPVPDAPLEIVDNPVEYLKYRRAMLRAIADGTFERPELGGGRPRAIEGGDR